MRGRRERGMQGAVTSPRAAEEGNAGDVWSRDHSVSVLLLPTPDARTL